MDISLRGELWDNDSADVLRFWGWRDITAPMDIAGALERAGGEDVTLLVNSPGGDMAVGLEIRSMLRRYAGKTTALFQGFGASAATLAATGCQVIQSEPGALLCYHNPAGGAEGDYRAMRRSAEALRNARDCILEVYTARGAFGRLDPQDREGRRPRPLAVGQGGQGVRPDRRDCGGGPGAGGGAGGLCSRGRAAYPADGGHAGAISGPCGGRAGRGGPAGRGGAHPGAAQGACWILRTERR